MPATDQKLLLVLQPLIVLTTNCAGNERLRSSSVWVLAINRLFDSHSWYSHQDGFQHVIILYIRTHQRKIFEMHNTYSYFQVNRPRGKGTATTKNCVGVARRRHRSCYSQRPTSSDFG
ncbi:hypothetical protein LC653_24825 [Nostoc sp. CHAB 5784]|uniref:hypothetical protein n=1 Tax=Nostoc mirabile TaxID=2907820 RepID=UPI001E518AED|nr:hypothetical protein [Nostoc mirabile]MCC5667024.1 hypothetical protein [Nostoc mirabile CHAB5784]